MRTPKKNFGYVTASDAGTDLQVVFGWNSPKISKREYERADATELPFQFSGLRPTRFQHLICMKVDAMRLNAMQPEVMQLHAVKSNVVQRQRDGMDLRSPAEPSPPPIQGAANPSRKSGRSGARA